MLTVLYVACLPLPLIGSVLERLKNFPERDEIYSSLKNNRLMPVMMLMSKALILGDADISLFANVKNGLEEYRDSRIDSSTPKSESYMENSLFFSFIVFLRLLLCNANQFGTC